MKITKTELVEIIQEELENSIEELDEQNYDTMTGEPISKDAVRAAKTKNYQRRNCKARKGKLQRRRWW